MTQPLFSEQVEEWQWLDWKETERLLYKGKTRRADSGVAEDGSSCLASSQEASGHPVIAGSNVAAVDGSTHQIEFVAVEGEVGDATDEGGSMEAPRQLLHVRPATCISSLRVTKEKDNSFHRASFSCANLGAS